MSVWCLYVCLYVTFCENVTYAYISAENKDNDTKLSGYVPWGLPSTSIMSWMTLSSKSPVRNPQRPPSTPLLDPPLPDTLLIKISTRNFQGIFLRVKKHHPWHHGWPFPPSLWSGTLNVLQVPPFLTPHSWHTSNKDINTKLSGYLPWGLPRSSMNYKVIGPKAQVMGRRPT